MDSDTSQQNQPSATPRRRRVDDVLVEQNKEICCRLLEQSLGAGDMSAIDRYASEDIVAHDPALLEPVRGRDAFRAVLENYRRVFPDLALDVELTFATGDLVCVRWRARGTHRAELLGVPATGREAEVTGVSIFKIRDGRVVEETAEWDALGLMRQLVDQGNAAQSELEIRAEIANMMTELADAFTRGEPDAVAAFFTDDATLINPAGARAQGRDQIRQVVHDDLRRILAGSKSTFILESMRACGPGLALVDATHKVEGARGEQMQGDLDLHVVCLCEKRGDRWMWRDARPHPYLGA